MGTNASQTYPTYQIRCSYILMLNKWIKFQWCKHIINTFCEHLIFIRKLLNLKVEADTDRKADRYMKKNLTEKAQHILQIIPLKITSIQKHCKIPTSLVL